MSREEKQQTQQAELQKKLWKMSSPSLVVI